MLQKSCDDSLAPGAGSCLNEGVQVRPFSFHRGVLAVAPVTVGRDCHVGAGCVLMPGSAAGLAVLGKDTKHWMMP